MSLASHVVSHPLALALRDAGYPQQATFFRWIRPEGPQLTPVQKFAEQDGFILTDTNYSFPEEWEHYSAPLASELMERMEGRLQHRFLLTIQKPDPDAYSAAYDDTVNAESLAYNCEKTLPDALAKSWLHLRKASLI